MNHYLIDIGSYSIKILKFSLGKKNSISLSFYKEFLTSDLLRQGPETLSIREAQLLEVEKFAQTLNKNDEYSIQFPQEMLTHRFLNLPITNLKKAEQMVPFQLDESIPYSLRDCHITSQIYKEANTSFALVNIVPTTEMERLYGILEQFSKYPKNISSELNYLSHLCFRYQKKGPYLGKSYVILDVGHRLTKVYFVTNGKIESVQFSHFGGDFLNQVIISHYRVSEKEAITFKEQKGFVVTEDHFDQLESEEQKDFAKLMLRAFSHLSLDLKRWLIGHRSRTGSVTEKIYLTGGTSQFKNFKTFLQSESGIRVEYLPPLDFVTFESSDLKDYCSLSPCLQGMVSSLSMPPKVQTIFQGDFGLQNSLSLSAHTTAFFASRILILSCLLSLGLGIEHYFLSKKIATVDRQFQDVLKTQVAGLSSKDRATYQRKPKGLFEGLKKKRETLLKEIENLQQKAGPDALSGLLLLSKSISYNEHIYLASIDSSNAGHVATLKAEVKGHDLSILETHLQKAGIPNLTTELVEDKKTLIVKFSGQSL